MVVSPTPISTAEADLVITHRKTIDLQFIISQIQQQQTTNCLRNTKIWLSPPTTT